MRICQTSGAVVESACVDIIWPVAFLSLNNNLIHPALVRAVGDILPGTAITVIVALHVS